MKSKKSELRSGENILDHLWAEVINLPNDGSWLNTFLRKRDAGSHPISKVNESMKRLVAAGASSEDLGRVGRAERYEVCFRVLYSLNDPGLKSGKLAGLHKVLAATKPGAKGKSVRDKAFFKSLWEDINSDDDGKFLLEQSKQPGDDGPFGDTGPALRRLLESGASANELGRLAAWHRFEAAKSSLQILAECFAEAEDAFGLHESLLMADPSGKEGRPGSWPVTGKPASKPKPTVQRQASQEPTTPCFSIPDIEDCDVNATGDVFLAWSSSDMRAAVCVHDLATGEQRSILKTTRDFNTVEMLDDGKRLVGSLNRSLAIIDVASDRKLVETRWKWFSTLLPTGKDLLVCASEWDKAGNDHDTYHLFDLATLKRKRSLEFKEAAGKLQHSSFAPNGQRLALLVLPPQADNYLMTIWSWPEAVCIGQWRTPIACFAWAADASWIAALTEDGVAVIEPCSGKMLWSTGERQHGLAVSPDGRWMASSNQGVISIWSIAERRKIRELNAGEGIRGLGIFSKNRLIVACCAQRCIFWDFKRLVEG